MSRENFQRIEREGSIEERWIFHLPHKILTILGIAAKISQGKESEIILVQGIETNPKLSRTNRDRSSNLEPPITRLLTDLTSLAPEEIDTKINEVLQVVGELEGSDRSYVFLFTDPERERLTNTHEWCAVGITPQKQNFQNFPVSDLPWFARKLDNQEIIHIPDVSSLGNEARVEKACLEEREIQSLIRVPIIYHQSLLGFVGFDSVREKKHWSNRTISLLETFAEILANTLHRQRSEIIIREQQKETTKLLNSLPGIVFKAKNQEGFPMKFLSYGCSKLTGYQAEELTLLDGENYNNIVHPDDIAVMLNSIKNELDRQNFYEVEYRIITKEGEQKWLWEKGRIDRQSENSEPEIEGFITDITPLKSAQQALKESEERYRLLAENVTDLISRHTADGVCQYASSACQALLGYEWQDLPRNFLFELCHRDDLPIIEEFRTRIQRKSRLEPISYRLRHRDGSYTWIEMTAKIILDSQTETVAEFIAVSRDINKRQQTEKALRKAEKQYRDIFENITQGVFQSSNQGHYLKANPALAKIYGYDSPHDLITHITDIERQLYVEPERRSLFIQLLDQQGGSISNFESRIYRKDGTIVWISESTRSVHDAQGNFLYYEGTVEDITYRLHTEAKLHHDAFYDALTGLHNRAWFMNELQSTILNSENENNSKYAVLFIDLDGFKVINDSFGHLVGDELLQKVAQRLTSGLRTLDKIARFGGDEFVILLENIEEISDAIKVAQRLQERLKIPFQLSRETVFISASIGITTSDLNYQRLEEPLRDADIAMYQAKAIGKACHAIFSPDMQKAVLTRLQIENDLRQALDNHEFRLYYQPIISLSDGMITGFEALLRWFHPIRGLISPSEFIPIAEETGLIHPIGWWVLQEACHQLQNWKSRPQGANSLSINVNLSAHQLKEVGLVKQIDHLLRKTGLEGRHLKLEITESAFLETIASKAIIVQQLKAFGLQLCIDDFGTGYSSLSRLHEFPIDTLKIDRSFINRLESNQTAIVQTILTLAHTLGMNVVAEGIETITQFEKLRELACEFGQGYLISPPVPDEVAYKFITEPISFESVKATG